MPDIETAAHTKTCPFCAETIKAAAVRCRYCQADLADVPEGAGGETCRVCEKLGHVGIMRPEVVGETPAWATTLGAVIMVVAGIVFLFASWVLGFLVGAGGVLVLLLPKEQRTVMRCARCRRIPVTRAPAAPEAPRPLRRKHLNKRERIGLALFLWAISAALIFGGVRHAQRTVPSDTVGVVSTVLMLVIGAALTIVGLVLAVRRAPQETEVSS